MEKALKGKKPTFHTNKRRSNSYRVMLWMLLLLGATGLLIKTARGEVGPLFAPTPTPTRVANSYIQQAEAYFAAGKIDDPNTTSDAIDTYKKALQIDPNNADVLAKLARIQTYSSGLLSSTEQQRNRLKEALASIDKAEQLAPDSSTVHAIRALVLDWTGSGQFGTPEENQNNLNQALDEATRALQLNPDDALALAFYAEVQLDQQKWSEAAQYAEKAVEGAPELMDTHRVYATVLEALGAYRDAIDQYERAVEITPNLTFLYIHIGVIYRHLAGYDPINGKPIFDKALSYFDQAVKINEQLQVRDPLPYIAIAKTYSQMGEFFIAARNAEKALSLNPADANTYGQLGIIYFKSKNYESSLPALKCAVLSCTASDNLVLQQLAQENPSWNVEPVAVKGMSLDSQEVAYYYAEYGQVLAYLSRPRENFCQEAVQVLEQVRNYPKVDSVLLEIVDGSESICQKLEGSPQQP